LICADGRGRLVRGQGVAHLGEGVVREHGVVSLALVEMADAELGALLPTYPAADSALRLERFFEMLYLRYDERFVYSTPDLKSITQRLEWSPDSPALQPGPGFPEIAGWAGRRSGSARAAPNRPPYLARTHETPGFQRLGDKA
jgi:hypothetical protein